MKECYFTANSIDEEAHKMLDELSKERERHNDIVFDIAKSALIVVDMQRIFCEPTSHAYLPSSAAIIPRIKMLINAFRVHNRPVFLTRHINSPQNAAMMAKWWHDIIRESDPQSELIEGLDGVVVRKTQYDGFYKTDLEKLLHEQNTTQVVIGGVMTHLCCGTTARAAFVRGFEVFIPIDATATYNETLHLSSLVALSSGFAIPTLVDELLQWMSR